MEDVFQIVLIHHARRNDVEYDDKVHNVLRDCKYLSAEKFGKHVDEHFEYSAQKKQEEYFHVALVNEKAQHDCKHGDENHHVDDEIEIDSFCVLGKIVRHISLRADESAL